MITQLNVMGIDPGKTVGIALWWGRDPWYESEMAQYQCNRGDALDMVRQWCYTSSKVGIKTLIGCETFTTRRDRNTVMTTQNDALEIIGAIKVHADATDTVLSMQSPALAKRAMSKATLKKFGWWAKETQGRHANDAARHVGGALLVHYPEILMSLHEHMNKT